MKLATCKQCGLGVQRDGVRRCYREPPQWVTYREGMSPVVKSEWARPIVQDDDPCCAQFYSIRSYIGDV